MGEQNSKLKPTDLREFSQHTEFSKKEIKEWYQGFKQDYPSGYLTVDEFKGIYGKK